METSASRQAAAARDVGPSPLAQLLRDRSVRLAAALAIAVAIPVAVLFYFQFRSLSDLGRSSSVVLRQLSHETADSATRGIEDWLKAPQFDVLLRVNQRQLEPLDLPFIRDAFERSLRTDVFVDRYYVWSDATDQHRDEVLAFDRASPDFVADPPEGAMLVQRARDLAPEKRSITSFEATVDGRHTYFLAQLRFTFPSREHLTSFVALRVDAERLRRDHFPAFMTNKLKNVEGIVGFPPLVVTVVDGDNQVIFPTNAPPNGEYVDERTFPLVFFEPELVSFAVPFASPFARKPEIWKVRTGYGTRTIPQIIAARERPQRAMMAVLAAVMALGVFFVVRAAAREVRLAELKANFVSGVSHDLKTPLALIQLFAETLELGRLKNTERAHEYYRIINSEARKLTRLINNLLDFSRIEAGLRQYRVEPNDLGALTRRVLDSLDSQFRHNEFTVTSRVTPNLPLVLMDPEAAAQAIENLLSNAMKYSPEQRHILVEVDSIDGFGRVRVTDNGIGIATRYQRKIFRKFYRVQTDAGSGAQGTGLGLAIVDHIMRALGGFVRVDSQPGRGSTFALHFPIHNEGHGDEADTGNRGRAADVARSA